MFHSSDSLLSCRNLSFAGLPLAFLREELVGLVPRPFAAMVVHSSVVSSWLSLFFFCFFLSIGFVLVILLGLPFATLLRFLIRSDRRFLPMVGETIFYDRCRRGSRAKFLAFLVGCEYELYRIIIIIM